MAARRASTTMAKPKAKTKPTANAKPAAGSVAASKRGQTASAPRTDDCGDLHDTEDKRRRVDRRDTPEQACRVMAKKLPHFDSQVLKTRLDKDGLKIKARIEIEILKERTVNNYLSGYFGENLYADYDLRAFGFTTMPLYGDDDDISDEFVDALAPASQKSTSERDCNPLKTYLKHGEALSCAECIEVLNSSLEGRRCSRHQSHSMLLAVLQHFGVHGLHTKFFDVFAACAATLDNALADQWYTMLAGGAQRIHFLKAYAGAVAVFNNVATMERLDSIALKKEQMPLDDLWEIVTTMIGAALFSHEARDLAYECLVKKCDSQKESMIYNDFTKDNVSAFTTIMRIEAEKLNQDVLQEGLAKKNVQPWCGEQVHVQLRTSEQMLQGRLLPMAKLTAISNGQVPRLPWETLFFGVDCLPGGLSTSIAPDHLIADAANCRNAPPARRADQAETTTVPEMIKDAHKAMATMIEYEKGFEIDAEFWATHVSPLIEKKVRAHVLECLPMKSDPTCDIGVAIDTVRGFFTSPLVLRSEHSIKDDVEGALELLISVSEGLGPSSRSLKRCSNFATAVVTKTANYLQFPAPPKGAALFAPRQVLVGRDAVDAILDDSQKSIADGSPQCDRIGELRKYRWLLNNEQFVATEKYIQLCIKADRDKTISDLVCLEDAPPSKQTTAGQTSMALVAAYVGTNGSKSTASLAIVTAHASAWQACSTVDDRTAAKTSSRDRLRELYGVAVAGKYVHVYTIIRMDSFVFRKLSNGGS
jgi:hypothetical protein